MIDIGLQHIVLLLVLVLFYFLPTETLHHQSSRSDD